MTATLARSVGYLCNQKEKSDVLIGLLSRGIHISQNNHVLDLLGAALDFR